MEGNPASLPYNVDTERGSVMNYGEVLEATDSLYVAMLKKAWPRLRKMGTVFDARTLWLNDDAQLCYEGPKAPRRGSWYPVLRADQLIYAVCSPSNLLELATSLQCLAEYASKQTRPLYSTIDRISLAFVMEYEFDAYWCEVGRAWEEFDDLQPAPRIDESLFPEEGSRARQER